MPLSDASLTMAGTTNVVAEVPAQSIVVQPTPPHPPLPPRTTEQEDLTTAGQRRINLVWEYTQSIIAAMVVLSNMIVGVYDGLRPHGTVAEYPVILSSSLFLIVGFYFSRTNHAAIGGIGPKPDSPYTGR